MRPVGAERAGQEATMLLYADTPGRRARQVVADLLVVGWLVLWVWIGIWIRDLVGQLGEPGRILENAGLELEERVAAAADTVADLPLVGSDLRKPLDVIASVGTDIAAAGVQQQETVSSVATGIMIVIIALAVAVILVSWLPWRLAWMVRARNTRAALAAPGAVAVFALRAIVVRPVRKVLGVHPDPAAAWREGDAVALRGLADLELASLGIRQSSAG